MYSKLLQTLLRKNEFSTKIVFRRKHDLFFSYRSRFRNNFLPGKTKYNLRDTDYNLKQSMYMSRSFSTSDNRTEINFEQACNETLELLSEYFEEIIENSPHFDNPDITYSDGVLTVQLGQPYGTYVINRQIPNKQIWLSSPTSGPKRYDLIDTKWLYKHDGVSLHELLTAELSKIVSVDVDFSRCALDSCTSK